MKKIKKMSVEVKKIKSYQHTPDGIFELALTRPISRYAAYFFSFTGISPNSVTFLSFLFSLAACFSLFFIEAGYPVFLLAAFLWWFGAVLDAADGDLARYTKTTSVFGAWFGSCLTRLKEFFIFGTLGYLAFKGFGLSAWGETFRVDAGNEFYILLGFLAILTNVMSGWISDTENVFKPSKKKGELKISERYLIGMTDTRDFFIIASLLLAEFGIALYLYGLVFPVILTIQIVSFFIQYRTGK